MLRLNLHRSMFNVVAATRLASMGSRAPAPAARLEAVLKGPAFVRRALCTASNAAAPAFKRPAVFTLPPDGTRPSYRPPSRKGFVPPGMSKLVKRAKKTKNLMKRGRRGLFHGKIVQFGNTISYKGKNKSRRKWSPNVKDKRFWSESYNRFLKFRVTTTTIRIVKRLKHGIDDYLMGTPNEVLRYPKAIRMKRRLLFAHRKMAELDAAKHEGEARVAAVAATDAAEGKAGPPSEVQAPVGDATTTGAAAAAAAVAQGDAVAGVAAGVTLMDASTVANDGAEEVRPYTPIPWLYRNTHSPTRKDRILSRLQKQRAMKVANRGRPMSKEQKREWSRAYEAREAAAMIEASKKRIAIAESKRRKAAAAAA